MRLLEERWLRLQVFDPGEVVPGHEDAAVWVRDWPRRRLALVQLWGGEPQLFVAEWPVGREVDLDAGPDDGGPDDGGLVGVGLFRPARLVCRVCLRDFLGLRVDGDGFGVFDRWRDGVHDVLKVCPRCGAARRDAGLAGVLAGVRPVQQ